MTEPQFTDQVEYLLHAVGPRMTAAGAGLQDARQLSAFRQGVAEPPDAVQLRVAALAECVRAITTDWPPFVAAGFLRGSQPELDDRSPLMALREATPDTIVTVQAQVRSALHAFIGGDS